MPFFNFRRGTASASNAANNAQPESMEVVRKRAKHRLIGAAVLVLAGVVGFPLLFDTQPRPIAVDIPIEIPGKNTVKPLVMPAKPEAATASAGTSTVAAASSLTPKEEIVAEKAPVSAPASPPSPPPMSAVAPLITAQAAPKKEAKPEQKPEPKPEQKPEPKLSAKPEAKPEPKPQPKAELTPAAKPAIQPAAKADDGARAKALLDGQATSAAGAAASLDTRLVVQVGAFADADKAKEVRQKLEKAGLKTYTQVAETKDGKRTRVRVGPFGTKAEADKAASKIKTLDLPASILTL